MRLPNFIIIGAMKSATSTLHEQLAAQPGIFMSTPKEPYFFSNDEVYEKGLDWYASLFADAPEGALCGESSTHYTKLPTYPDTIARMREHVPGAKLIYVMRHPIDRLVSQYYHEWRDNVLTEPIDEAIDKYEILTAYSRYTMQLQPFFDSYGQENVLPVFFDRIKLAPQDVLEQCCAFLGYDGSPEWKTDLYDSNVSNVLMRKSPIRDAIVFAPGVSWLRQNLVPRSVRDRAKSLWKLREKPALSKASVAKLQRLFDPDLAVLGGWLGVDLSCENFKAVTGTQRLAWSAAPAAKQSP